MFIQIMKVILKRGTPQAHTAYLCQAWYEQRETNKRNRFNMKKILATNDHRKILPIVSCITRDWQFDKEIVHTFSVTLLTDHPP